MAIPSIYSNYQLDYGIEGSLRKIIGKGYNEKGNLDSVRRFHDTTTVFTGASTVTTEYINYPQIANSKTSFRVGNTSSRPVSTAISPIKKATVTAAAGGIIVQYATTNLRVDSDGVIGIPLKVSSTTPTINVILTSVGGGGDALTFANLNLTNYGFANNTWKNLMLRVSQGTLSGAFNPNAIVELKITASAAVDIWCQEIQTANNLMCLVGAEAYLEFKCPKELTNEIDRKVSDVMCQNTTVDTRSTGYSATVKFKSLGLSLTHEGYINGTAVKADSTQWRIRKVIGDGGIINTPISAGVITSGVTVVPDNIISVNIEGVLLSRVDNVSQVADNTFHVTTAGVFTFSTGYNGKTPEVIDKTQQFGSYVVDKGIVDSFSFEITSPRDIEGGILEEITYHKVKFNSIARSQEDAYVDSEVEMSVVISPDGKYRTIIQ